MPRLSSRQNLIDAGLDLVWREGFGRTGVATIAAWSQVPKGSFYNHFASKDEFGEVLIDEYWAQTQAELEGTLGDDARSGWGRIASYFALLREQGERDHYASGCLIGNLAAEAAPLSDAMRERLGHALTDWAAMLARAIATAQDDGSIETRASAAGLAAVLVDAWQGALLRAKVLRTPEPLDLFRNELLPALLAPAASA